MFRLMMSTLVALWLVGFASPAAAGAERAIKALFGCHSDFFETLKSERGAFRSHEVRTVFQEDLRIDIVVFDPPVDVLALRLTSYRHETFLNYGGRPVAFSWGFQFAETPARVALALETLFPAHETFRGTRDLLLPLQSQPDHSRKSFVIAKARLEGETGANLECHSTREALGNLWSLPDVVDLFFDTWDNKGRWLAWISDWLP